MMRIFGLILAVAFALVLSGCGNSKFRKYYGPEVTLVQVHKAERKMYLFHHDKVLKEYDIALGFNPLGHKQFEGDGKTPEGTYIIDRRNPQSNFHLSLGISYPNLADRAFAETQGKEPGGEIFIHGGPNRKMSRRDWTEGCIAVTDRQMETIYAMVKDGTVINILP